jgi:hypothetical protein
MILDVGVFRLVMNVTQHDLHDVHKQLELVAKELHKWSAQGGGLLAVSPADVNDRNEEWLATRGEDHARLRRLGGRLRGVLRGRR